MLNNARKKYISPIYFLIVFLIVLLFFLCDVLKINNYTGERIFLNTGNFFNIMNQVSLNAIIAFPITLAIIIQGIDLSVGSVAAFIGVLLCKITLELNIPFIPAVLIVLTAGTLIGMLNGFIIARFNLPAFVVTLGAMIIMRGLALLLVDGIPIFNDSKAFLFLGNGTLAGFIPMPVVVLLVVFVLFLFFMKKTVWAKHIYALGGNEEAAKLSGVNVTKIKLLVYSLSTLMASLAGILLASRLGSGQPNAGEGYELDAITAAIVGGTSLSGGVGTIGGTLGGAIIIGIINTGMNTLGISPYYQFIIKGSVILAAVIVDRNIAEKGRT
ncbi:ABC transporter permease [Treponema sp. HNW]|uniref:ABC transporter permease n=1 Tax=Treponema sp. HNW TaxID=3116654 RepID=UPI003D0EBCE4